MKSCHFAKLDPRVVCQVSRASASDHELLGKTLEKHEDPLGVRANESCSIA